MKFLKTKAKDIKVGDRIDYDDHSPIVLNIEVKNYIEILLDFGVTQIIDIWEPEEEIYKIK